MPSHTFTRVGAWDESIDANLKSAEVANREHAVTDEMHAMDYLVYAYLQTARDRAAGGVAMALEDLLVHLPKGGTTGITVDTASGYFAAAAIPARYALERSAWAEAAALTVRPSSSPQVPAITYFAGPSAPRAAERSRPRALTWRG